MNAPEGDGAPEHAAPQPPSQLAGIGLVLAAFVAVLVHLDAPFTYWTMDALSALRPLADRLAAREPWQDQLVGSHPPLAAGILAQFALQGATVADLLLVPRLWTAFAAATMTALVWRQGGARAGLLTAGLLATDPWIRFHGAWPDNYPVWAAGACVLLATLARARPPWADSALALLSTLLCLHGHVLAAPPLLLLILAGVRHKRPGLVAGFGLGVVLSLPLVSALAERGLSGDTYSASGWEPGAFRTFVAGAVRKGLLDAGSAAVALVAAIGLATPGPGPDTRGVRTVLAQWLVLTLMAFGVSALTGAASLHQHPYLFPAQLPWIALASLTASLPGWRGRGAALALGAVLALRLASAWRGDVAPDSRIDVGPERLVFSPQPPSQDNPWPALFGATPVGGAALVIVEHRFDNDEPLLRDPWFELLDPKALTALPPGHLARRGRCFGWAGRTLCLEGHRQGGEPGALPEVLAEAVAEFGTVSVLVGGSDPPDRIVRTMMPGGAVLSVEGRIVRLGPGSGPNPSAD